MRSLEAILGERLRSAERVAVLAIGSTLRGDDAAGMLAGDALVKLAGPAAEERLSVFLGGTAPENLTGAIKAFGPTHLVIVDAADMGCEPGHAALIEEGAAGLNTSASTHGLPVTMLAEYLRSFTGCEVVIVGIQPGGREFGQEPSERVRAAAERVAAAIAAAMQLPGRG